MSKSRRHFSGPEKVAILKRHLVDKVPISDLCDELDLYPTQLYAWLKEFFENGHAAFDNTPPRFHATCLVLSSPSHFTNLLADRCGLSSSVCT